MPGPVPLSAPFNKGYFDMVLIKAFTTNKIIFDNNSRDYPLWDSRFYQDHSH